MLAGAITSYDTVKKVCEVPTPEGVTKLTLYLSIIR